MKKPKITRKFIPVPHTGVRIEGSFWGERLRINREVTIPAQYRHCKRTGRIDAFKLERMPGAPSVPHMFWDSDVEKWIEAASYSIATHPDPRLEKRIDDVIDLIASAQQDDGYLNTYFTIVEPGKRWTNLRDCHELYCAGTLMEAGVAYYEATGKRALLDVACRCADHIGTVFGRGRGQKRGYPGHEEIELALVKLYRATGHRRYLDLASYFINERGQAPSYFEKEARQRGEKPGQLPVSSLGYRQAYLPVREQTTAEGHAVRACYLYAGMADVAAETGDRELLAACRTVWKNMVQRRMYIHGGIGSARLSERFTVDHDLPNEEAYAETCAAIALVFFAHRMLQIEADARYSDVMERALYNGILSGVSLDGKRYFYENYLAFYPAAYPYKAMLDTPTRQEWFWCPCCPPNLARLLASLGQYVYSQTDTSIFVHLYVNGQATIRVRGRDVELVQETRYPWAGDVKIRVRPPSPATFTVAVRIPGWCKGAPASVNGKKVPVKPGLRKGYLNIRRRWQKGDRIELQFPMPVERIEAHPSVRHDCGRVALQRGPVVYCLEEKDNGKDLHDILLRDNMRFTVKNGTSGPLKGVPLVSGRACHRDKSEWKASLYRSSPSRLRPRTITAIPYFTWANRGVGEMLTWIRQDESRKTG